jgi:hypothetical protein
MCLPFREVEYGELFCYGINSIGTQRDPCIFVLEAAGGLYGEGAGRGGREREERDGLVTG